MSGNRKYTQLTLSEVEVLLEVLNLGYFTMTRTDGRHLQRIALVNAVSELVGRAQELPDARVCLAHAVTRGGR